VIRLRSCYSIGKYVYKLEQGLRVKPLQSVWVLRAQYNYLFIR